VTIWSPVRNLRGGGKFFPKESHFPKVSLLSKASLRSGTHENQRNPA
jgi:hypothetical protein